jgi:hypothetical protein
MAGRGPAPQSQRVRHNDNARREAEMTELEDDGDLYGKPLPDGITPDGEPWHPETLELWESLRRHPLLKDEPPLGWAFLRDTALQHHIMWTKGRWEFASEVRLRLAKYGATPEDRMRLKIKVKTPADEAKKKQPSANVSDIASRRARLASSD